MGNTSIPLWGRLVNIARALHKLQAAPEETTYVFEVLRNSDPHMLDRNIVRLRKEHGPVFMEKRELIDLFLDKEIPQYGGDTLAGCYQRFIEEHRISPLHLLDVWRRRGQYPVDRTAAWYLRRDVVCHDLGHLLNNYGTDPVGETEMVWFNVGQEPGPGWITLGILGLLRYPTRLLRFYAAFRRGRRSNWLIGSPFDQYANENIEQVRARIIRYAE